ncbi:MAG: 4-hydroxythreonine-4-phosphate dehydrogenase PdxA [Bacteroidales bacterium]|nr:4-hydroxythreonine-4-phosphate dehydrogenase PdxA [Bacteroidales bacterium]
MSKPITVGITQGDINGISYELIIKTLLDARMLEVCTPVVYGSSKVLSYHRKLTPHGTEFNYNVIHQVEQAHARKSNILNITDQEIKVDLGEATAVAGQAALEALELASNDLLANKLAAVVTAPVNKRIMQSDQFHFSGHTEYFAEKTNTKDFLMLMVSGKLRIGTVTTHCALKDVSQKLSKNLILNKIKVLNQSLVTDFACTKPRIAVLSLNPHAGEGGLFGNEEEQFIQPAIREAFEQKIYAFGPFPADGFFGSGQYAQYDAVLAMYHDQAMLPFKLLSYGEGVNYTAGLPVIRTSPAHGTAYDIVGKGLAEVDSFRNAIYLACDIYANRHRAQLDEEMEIAARRNEGEMPDE